jgi:hypothetical protein
MLAKRLPLDALLQTTRPQLPPLTLLPPGLIRGALTEQDLAQAWDAALKAAQNDAAGRAADAQRGCFWFVRRRQLPYTTEVASVTMRLGGDVANIDKELNARLAADNVAPDFANNIAPRLPLLTRAEATNLLVAPKLEVKPEVAGVFATGNLLRRSAYADLKALMAATPAVDPAAPTANEANANLHAQVLRLVQRFGDPRLGEGFDTLWQASDEAASATLADAAALRVLAAAGVTPELDAAIRRLPHDKRTEMAGRLAERLRAGDAAGVRELVASAPQ